jgi:UDP-N-acetylmuramoyl-L-alanyl-D-glutamate--2,6-diaminopimelate ligase
VRFQPEATHFVLNGWEGKVAIESPLIGEFNVYNVAAAATAALALGISPSAIQQGVATLAPVLGRMQRMDAGQPSLAPGRLCPHANQPGAGTYHRAHPCR